MRLTTDYGRDIYGNVTTTTVSGIDITTQTTTQAYDNRGRFVTGLTNAESQVETIAVHPGFGSLTQYTDPNSLVSTFQYNGFGHMTRATDPDSRYSEFTYVYCSGIPGGSASCPTHGAAQVTATPKRADGTTQSGPITRVYYDRLSRVIAEDIEIQTCSNTRIQPRIAGGVHRLRSIGSIARPM